MVGDRYQSIYAFRGATNALDTVKADRTFYLTSSFRFGPQVANVASELLRIFYQEHRPVVGRGFDTQLGTIEDDHKYAALCRTNSEVFSRAAMAIREQKSTAFVGGVKSYNFDKILDAYHMSIQEQHLVRDPFIRSMGSFAALEQYAMDSGDPDSKRLVKVVHEHGHAIPGLVKTIYEKSIPDIHSADRVFSTGHKAKGLDIKHVVLAEDYKPIMDNNQPILDKNELPLQEVNLTYVSLTRAVERLQLNQTLSQFMQWVDF